jgi:streptogramin lyase
MWLLILTVFIAASFISWAALATAAESSRTIDTVAGTGQPAAGPASGPAREVPIGDPFGVEIGPDQALYITEVRHHRVRRLDLKTGHITTVAGCGEKGYDGDGGPATAARLNEPYEVRFDTAGNMYFVEMMNHVVRKVAANTGVITTIAGTGQAGYSGDGGPATKATFRQPHSIVIDDRQGLLIADIGNHRVRRVDLKTGIVTSIAGNGEKKLPTAGQQASERPVLGPRALYFFRGELWVALREGHSVWRLGCDDGSWHPVAGTGQKGFSGDGGPALQANFDGPKGITLDQQGNLYVVDTENQAIRRIDKATGLISTIAGGGPQQRGGQGDGGPATQAQLDRPHGIGIAPDGTLYIGDTLNHRVRRLAP